MFPSNVCKRGKWEIFSPAILAKSETMTDPPCPLHIVESTIIKENG